MWGRLRLGWGGRKGAFETETLSKGKTIISKKTETKNRKTKHKVKSKRASETESCIRIKTENRKKYGIEMIYEIAERVL